jgi:hypothetical protein
MAEGGANVTEVDYKSERSTLLIAIVFLVTVQWLLEHGGADITDTAPRGWTVWDSLQLNLEEIAFEDNPVLGQVTALLRVVVLRSAPPADLVARMFLQHSSVVQEGARPLRALVSSYEEPTTTEELWATGLGALS